MKNNSSENGRFKHESLFEGIRKKPIEFPGIGSCFLVPSWLFGNERVKCISAFDDTKFALVTESNNVYVYGMSSLVGSEIFVTYSKRDISKVAAPVGCQLRPPKSVFKNGQLELDGGRFTTSNDFQIKSVKCGQNFVAFLCRNGEIFVVGDNSMRCIGLPSPNFYGIMSVIRFGDHELIRGETIIDVKCGASFSIYLTNSGKVFYTGSLEEKYCQYMDPVIIPEEHKAKSIFVYGKGMAILMRDNKTVFYIITGLFNKKALFEVPEHETILDIQCGEEYIGILVSNSHEERLKCYTLVVTERIIQNRYDIFNHLNKSSKPEITFKLLERFQKISEFTPKKSVGCELYNVNNAKLSLPCLVYEQVDSLVTEIITRDVQFMFRKLKLLVANPFQCDIDLITRNG